MHICTHAYMHARAHTHTHTHTNLLGKGNRHGCEKSQFRNSYWNKWVLRAVLKEEEEWVMEYLCQTAPKRPAWEYDLSPNVLRLRKGWQRYGCQMYSNLHKLYGCRMYSNLHQLSTGGTYLPDTNATSDTQCLPCPIGQYCPELSLIHIWRCRRITGCRSRWSPYH